MWWCLLLKILPKGIFEGKVGEEPKPLGTFLE